MRTILVIGLPGSGKTTFAKKLYDVIKTKDIAVNLHNADDIRKQNDDWDFSFEGRRRQAMRMRDLANEDKRNNVITICDFVCPLETFRKMFMNPIIVWMNTIDKSQYEDTNKMFREPSRYNYKITNFDQTDETISAILQQIYNAA